MQRDNVLAYIEHVLNWQEATARRLAVEVDGIWYGPPWIFGDNLPIAQIGLLLRSGLPLTVELCGEIWEALASECV